MSRIKAINITVKDSVDSVVQCKGKGLCAVLKYSTLRKKIGTTKNNEKDPEWKL